jgi:tRNA(fMet)-specific endonuclease VapC
VRFLLDSNAVIAILKGHPSVLAGLQQHHPRDFALPAIVAHELYYGAYKGQRQRENLMRIEALRFEVLDFDREDGRRAAQLRAHLAAQGTPIGPYDVLIAGQALSRDLTVITHNTREFQRVPGLHVEDWQ